MVPLTLAQIEAHWGFLLIIAFLLGMGTPYPGRSKNLERAIETIDALGPLLAALSNLMHRAEAPPPETPTKPLPPAHPDSHQEGGEGGPP